MTATMSKPRRVALIGYGALGQAVAGDLIAGKLPGVAFVGTLTRPDSSRAR